MSTKILDAVKQDYQNSFQSQEQFGSAKSTLVKIILDFKFKTDHEMHCFLVSRLNEKNIWENQISKNYSKFSSELRAEMEQLVERMNEYVA